MKRQAQPRDEMKNPFAIIRSPFAYEDGSGEYLGRVESAHPTRAAAWRRYDASQAANKRANPNTCLNLVVVEVSSPNEPCVGERTRGKSVSR